MQAASAIQAPPRQPVMRFLLRDTEPPSAARRRRRSGTGHRGDPPPGPGWPAGRPIAHLVEVRLLPGRDEQHHQRRPHHPREDPRLASGTGLEHRASDRIRPVAKRRAARRSRRRRQLGLPPRNRQPDRRGLIVLAIVSVPSSGYGALLRLPCPNLFNWWTQRCRVVLRWPPEGSTDPARTVRSAPMSAEAGSEARSRPASGSTPWWSKSAGPGWRCVGVGARHGAPSGSAGGGQP